MERRDTARFEPKSPGKGTAVAAAFAIASLSIGVTASAQTRSARDTATAYGARLTAKGEPANLNPNRINSRISSRIDTRLSLRVERYRPDSIVDPTAAFAVRSNDNVRINSQATLSPMAPSSEDDTRSFSQGSPVSAGIGTPPR